MTARPPCDRERVRPVSFNESLSSDWSAWVLTNGLPDLPGPDLDAGQSVPVAYWIGPTTAAVLHVRHLPKPIDEQAVAWVDRQRIETNVDLFYLVDGAWAPWGGGGGGWADHPAVLARSDLPTGWVNLSGMTGGRSGDRGCKALWGQVGTGAAFAEVMQAGQVVRRAVEAPIGAFVACGEYHHPFTVRILSSQNALLAEVAEPPGFEL
jgi:hypothetical protein